MLSHPLHLTLCLYACNGQSQAVKKVLRAAVCGPMAQSLLGWGISLICRAGKGAALARRGAELAAVSMVLLLKVLSVCVGCHRRVWGLHLITCCCSHTPCGTHARKAMAVKPLAVAFSAIFELLLCTRHTGLWQKEKYTSRRTGHVGLWIRHSNNSPGLHKPSRALPHVKLQAVSRLS